jgi:predicted nucleic acid-binding protein
LPRHRRPTAGGAAAPARLFVDSGAWIALVSARDQHHAEAETMFRAASTRKVQLLTTNLVLAETHRLLLSRAGIRPAMWALDRFEASPLLRIVFVEATHHRAARAWLERLADQSISFAVMDATRCNGVMSFDHDFLLAGFSLWFG